MLLLRIHVKMFERAQADAVGAILAVCGFINEFHAGYQIICGGNINVTG